MRSWRSTVSGHRSSYGSNVARQLVEMPYSRPLLTMASESRICEEDAEEH